MSQHPLPVTIIGGYLGAGKTTLVNHLLRHANGRRLAILVNEFGDLPIDEDLIEALDDDIISIAGGCVCCSFGSDLTAGLMDLAKLSPPPDHVVLESSGVAIPGAIAATIGLLSDVAVAGIVVLGDAETLRKNANHKFMGDTVTRQLADADLVILNKADLVAEAYLADLRSFVGEHAKTGAVLDATHGQLPVDVVLDTHADPQKPRLAGPHGATGFDSTVVDLPQPVDPEALARTLSSADLNLVRAKGFVRGVDYQTYAVQCVARRWTVTKTDHAGPFAVVCIGFSGSFDAAAIGQAVKQSAGV